MQKVLCSNWNISQRQETSSASNCCRPIFWAKLQWPSSQQTQLISTSLYIFAFYKNLSKYANCLSLPASEISKFLFLEILFAQSLFAQIILSQGRSGVSIAAAFCKMWEKTFLLPTSKRLQQNVTAMKKLVIRLQLSPRWPFQEDCGCQCLFRCKNPSQTETLPAWALLHDWLSVTQL